MESFTLFPNLNFRLSSTVVYGFWAGMVRLALAFFAIMFFAIMSSRAFWMAAAIWGAAASWGIVNSGVAAERLEYNRDIRPILAEHCFACHGADSASRQADLRLDQRQAAIDMGAIEPGQPDNSELIARIISPDVDLVMPPPETQKPLSAQQIELLKQWVRDGAEYQLHWSFLTPSKAALPNVNNSTWAKNTVDRFVLATLEQHDLMPAPEADARTLFRRLHLDITGLPPTAADIAQFEQEWGTQGDSRDQEFRDREEVLSKWIDHLMNLPAWGEHRARYWLDAARYGDTHGLHFDNYREMWPYRDWVIRAFNANQPFDRFSVEQLAGDLLPDPTNDQLIATGFQRCNMTTNEGGTIDEENLAIYATDRVQTFGWVYLGLTTNCAQCHDHKFDPISIKDYYSLAAFFRNTTQPAKDGNVKDGRSSVLVVPSAKDRPRWESLPEEIVSATALRKEREKCAKPDFETWLAAATPEALDQAVPQEGLVLCATLNEGSGNELQNTAISANAIKATGKLSWIVDGKLGPAPQMKSGATLELGGLGDFQRSDSFSYGAWIKVGKKDASAGIIARMDEQNKHRGWDLYQSGGTLSVHIVDSWPDNALKVSTKREVVNPKAWQHVFVTYDGSGKAKGVKIYVDGKEEPLKIDNKSLQSDASIQSTTPLRIGQRSAGAVFEGGAIQDVRLYSRMLNAAEIGAIADIMPLKELIKTPAGGRSQEQEQALYAHFLQGHDAEYMALTKAMTELEQEREAIRSRSPITHIQQEKMDSLPMANVLMRGEYDRPGEEVSAAPPSALHPLPKGAPNNRLGLAQWVVDPANPLTARVTVNRFWQEVFGSGIVATPEDLGVMGMMPSHPELLDWLAVDFREHGWDVKRLFKQMLMSATYRQSAQATPEKLEKDRNNVWLSRGPRYRMDAEMVRDYALYVSGLQSDKMFGRSVKPLQPDKIWDMVGLPSGDTREYVPDEGEGRYRRTLYTFWKRMAPPPNLEAFNAPSREVCTVRRERTNTPLQALVTLNDPQFFEAALSLAQHAMQIGGDDKQAVVNEIAQRVLCRPLNAPEATVLHSSHHDLLEYYQTHTDDAQAILSVGQSRVNEQLPVAELAAWTMVCNQVLNLDEALCK